MGLSTSLSNVVYANETNAVSNNNTASNVTPYSYREFPLFTLSNLKLINQHEVSDVDEISPEVVINTNISNINNNQETFLGVTFLTEYDASEMIKTKNLTKSSNLINEIKFEDSFLLEDISSETYFITVGSEITGNFQTNNGINYYWLEEPEEILNMIEQNKPLSLLAIMENNYQELEITISTLPLISIQADDIPDKKDGIYIDGTITIYEANNDKYQENTYKMHYKVRGATSSTLAKKPFKVELLKEDGSRNAESLLGLRKDDDWNLTPMFTDYSLIREATVLSLYDELSKSNEASEIHPQSLVLCELFINNQYWGFYELIEPMDKRNVEIDENTDFIYKGTSWVLPSSEELRENNYSENDLTSIEAEYYPQELFDERFTLIANYVENYHENNITLEELCNMINLENFIDNAIFTLILSLGDNDIKNMFYVARMQSDGSYLIGKEYFDFNHSLGDNWDTNNIEASTIYHIDRRLSNNLTDYNFYLEKYIQRYEQLRSSIFTEENIISVIDNYIMQVTKSGTVLRNHSSWDIEADIHDEYTRLVNFVKEHLVYADAYVDKLRSY